VNLFIRIELLPAAQTLTSLITLCPVNIFALHDGQVVVQDERQDECTLCELCLTAAPVGALRIHKLYEGESQGA
jgi:NAD-dependent dihydropyrimidine dehydrogenase PreA subunit